MSSSNTRMPPPPPRRPPPPPPLPAAVLASLHAAPTRLLPALALSPPEGTPPPPPPPPTVAVPPRVRVGNGYPRPLPPVLAGGAGALVAHAGGRGLGNQGGMNGAGGTGRGKAWVGGLQGKTDGSVVPVEARRYFTHVGTSRTRSRRNSVACGGDASSSLPSSSSNRTSLAFVSFRMGTMSDRPNSPPRAGTSGTTISDLLLSTTFAQQQQHHRWSSPQLRLCTVGVYSLEDFLPKIGLPDFSFDRPQVLAARRQTSGDGDSSDRRCGVCSSVFRQLPMDLWCWIAEHLTQLQWLSFSESCAYARRVALNDRICARLLLRDDAKLFQHISAPPVGFSRFGAYVRLYGYRQVRVRQVPPNDGTPRDVPSFLGDLPRDQARYVVADLASYNLAFAHDSAIGCDLVNKAQEQGFQKPGALVMKTEGVAGSCLCQRPTVGLLWTPPLTPMKERTVFALVHGEIKKVLHSLASIEAAEFSELDPRHVELYIPRKFRFDLVAAGTSQGTEPPLAPQQQQQGSGPTTPRLVRGM